jgi:acetyltransferase-like isoleucine patch superfamily enzyme
MAGRVEYLGYHIGAWSYGSPRVLSWGEGTKLQVGKFCSIADGVTILLGGNHRTDWITTYPFTAFWRKQRRFRVT